MGNHLKGCGYRRCKSGMHTKSGGKRLQKLIRRARRTVKLALRIGQEPPTIQSIGYTD